MKNHNKSNTFAMIAAAVLLLLQAAGNTASADFKGYWLDEVRSYQANAPREYQPAPASYLDNPAAVYVEPAQRQPVVQPYPNPVSAPVDQNAGQTLYYSR